MHNHMNEGQSSVRTMLLENFVILLHSNIHFLSKKSKKFKILVKTDPHYKTFLGNEANRGSGQRKSKPFIYNFTIIEQ